MSTTTTVEKQSGRHPVNVGHLVMGIAFLAIVGVWALIQGDVVEGSDVRWLLPVPWVLAGLGGLLAIALAGRRRRATGARPTVPAAEPENETENEHVNETDPTEEIR